MAILLSLAIRSKKNVHVFFFNSPPAVILTCILDRIILSTVIHVTQQEKKILILKKYQELNLSIAYKIKGIYGETSWLSLRNLVKKII